MNVIFSWQKHSKIKFISSRHRVISSLYISFCFIFASLNLLSFSLTFEPWTLHLFIGLGRQLLYCCPPRIAPLIVGNVVLNYFANWINCCCCCCCCCLWVAVYNISTCSPCRPILIFERHRKPVALPQQSYTLLQLCSALSFRWSQHRGNSRTNHKVWNSVSATCRFVVPCLHIGGSSSFSPQIMTNSHRFLYC